MWINGRGRSTNIAGRHARVYIINEGQLVRLVCDCRFYCVNSALREIKLKANALFLAPTLLTVRPLRSAMFAVRKWSTPYHSSTTQHNNNMKFSKSQTLVSRLAFNWGENRGTEGDCLTIPGSINLLSFSELNNKNILKLYY